jgi:hypothetical protein
MIIGWQIRKYSLKSLELRRKKVDEDSLVSEELQK